MFKGNFLIIKDMRLLDGFKFFCYTFTAANTGNHLALVGTAQSFNWGFNAMDTG